MCTWESSSSCGVTKKLCFFQYVWSWLTLSKNCKLWCCTKVLFWCPKDWLCGPIRTLFELYVEVNIISRPQNVLSTTESHAGYLSIPRFHLLCLSLWQHRLGDGANICFVRLWDTVVMASWRRRFVQKGTGRNYVPKFQNRNWKVIFAIKVIFHCCSSNCSLALKLQLSSCSHYTLAERLNWRCIFHFFTPISLKKKQKPNMNKFTYSKAGLPPWHPGQLPLGLKPSEAQKAPGFMWQIVCGNCNFVWKYGKCVALKHSISWHDESL